MIKQQRWNWHYNLECNASDSYLVCLDDVLDIRDTGNFDRFEFDYVGVIIGDDIKFGNNIIVTDFTRVAKIDKSLNEIKKLYKDIRCCWWNYKKHI